MNRCCFIAIVKNEGPNIERCLESVRNIVTSYMICDTGSTDDTVSKIENYMKGAGIPGEVIHKEWQNYGFNRSYLMWKLQTHPVYGKAKYICWLDADEVYLTDRTNPLSYPTKADAEKLFKQLDSRPEPVFMAMTYYGNLQYLRWQFCRNNQVYLWRLPYQEYFKATQDEHVAIIDFLYNLARHEGNSSRDPDIIKKRIAMMENWFKLGIGSNVTDPSGFVWPGPREDDVPRVHYYLGEAYKYIDKTLAVYHYKKRMTMQGFTQERYVAAIDLARLVDKETEKLAYLLGALEEFPQRLEAPYYLMRHYQDKQDFKKAAAMGILAPEGRTPAVQDLFVEHAIYDYLFDLNYAVCCVYGGHEKTAYEIGKKVFEQKKYPPEMENQVKQNLVFFSSKLPKGGMEVPEGLNFQTKLRPELPELFIIDHLYSDPNAIRQFALEQTYDLVSGYPGKKTSGFSFTDTKEVLEKILHDRISYWPETNGQFQYITKKGVQRITRDHSDYTAVVFLTPNAPSDKGLFFYKHKETGSEEGPDNEFTNQSKWEITERISHKFNRVVIFKSKRNHQYDHSMGNSLETGFLVQVFRFSI